LNSVHQQPIPNLNRDASAAENVTRVLLANLSLSSVGQVQCNSQPMQYLSQPLTTLLAGSSPGILPISAAGVSCGSPSLSAGFPLFSNGQVIDLTHGLPSTHQSPASLQEMTQAFLSLPQGVGSNGQNEALAVGGGEEKGDVLRALLALHSHQQCDINLGGNIGATTATGANSCQYPTSSPYIQPSVLKGNDPGYPIMGPGVLKGVSGLM